MINNNRQRDKQPISFTGLKAALTKTNYVSPEGIQKLLGIYTREQGNIGTLPREIISILRKNIPFPAKIDEEAKKVMSLLVETGCLLKEKDAEVLRIINSTNFQQHIDEVINNMVNQNLGSTEHIFTNISKTSKEFMERLEGTSSQFITNSMTEIGLIPQGGTIKVEHIGEGVFNNSYNVSFLDEDGRKLFHDKVLKVYKDLDLAVEIRTKMQIGLVNYFKSLTEEQFCNKMSVLIDKSTTLSMESKIRSKSRLHNDYEKFLKTPIEKIDEIFGIIDEKRIKERHGIGPEAKFALYVKKENGHPLDKSDVINPYFYNLKKKIGFTEKADNDLPSITRHVNFRKLKIKHDGDLEHPKNKVAGRMIDFGGTTIENNTSLKNKEEKPFDEIARIVLAKLKKNSASK